MTKRGDLLAMLPDAAGAELFETLVARDGVRIERIISKGQTTPVGEWYDQPWHEWVLLLKGEALVQLEGEPELCRLVPGQWILLPARHRHRVEWTLPERETVWLALHWPLEITKEES
jgi:cupin 2 domain-containing protein